jgi:hypothetical protein
MESALRVRIIAITTALSFGLTLVACRGHIVETNVTAQWETDEAPIREEVLSSQTEVEVSARIGFPESVRVDHAASELLLTVTTDAVHTPVRTEQVQVVRQSRERELGSRTRKGNQTPGECLGAIMLGVLAVAGTAGLIVLVDAARTANQDDDDLTFPGCPDSGYEPAAINAGGGSGGGDGPCKRTEWMEKIDRVVDTREEVETVERVVRDTPTIHESIPTDGGWFTFTGELIPDGEGQVVSRKGELVVPFQPTYPMVLAPTQDGVADAVDLEWLDESCRLAALFHITNHATASETVVEAAGEAPDADGNLTVRGSGSFVVPVWIAPLPDEVLAVCEGT